MGAWSFGPFDNDSALDWLWDLEESSDTTVIAAAFERVTGVGEKELVAGVCTNAIASAEIVAALTGHPLAELPERAQKWLDAHKDLDARDLVPKALAALKRIRRKSELKELWDEGMGGADWYGTLDDLTVRLIGKEIEEMEEKRKVAYRHLIYAIVVAIRNYYPPRRKSSRNPFVWWKQYRRSRMVREIADWLHDLALYDSKNFVGFDELLFWSEHERLSKRYPREHFERYREIFDEFLKGKG